MNRQKLLTFLGVSLALAVTAGCGDDDEYEDVEIENPTAFRDDTRTYDDDTELRTRSSRPRYDEDETTVMGEETPRSSEIYPGASPTEDEETAGDVQPQPPLDEDNTEEVPGPTVEYEEDQPPPQ